MQSKSMRRILGCFIVLLLPLVVLVGCNGVPVQPLTTPEPSPAPSTPTPAPSSIPGTPSSPAKLPVIYNDDGSPDGTTALLYLLSDPEVSVKAVIISNGEAHPQTYIQHMGRMLETLGIPEIPLGTGQDSALVPYGGFPNWLRDTADNFWGLSMPNAEKKYPTQEAAKLIVSQLNQATEPATIFVSGPSTDLALALRLDPGIRKHIKAVYMMGGAINVPGNLTDFPNANPDNNVSGEWNIYIDPLAASEVFQSGLLVNLVPLDATNQISATLKDTEQWRAGNKLAKFAADIYSSFLGSPDMEQMGLWDVVTAEIMVHPDLCPTVPMHLKVITDKGKTLGQTLVLNEGEPNIQVCLKPDIPGIKQALIKAFTGSR
jgi:inosine-uridine nucleoside N-ribohydrolase